MTLYVSLPHILKENIETSKTTKIDSGDGVCKSNGSDLIRNDAIEKENPKSGGTSGSLNIAVIADPVLKETITEIAMIAEAGDATLDGSKTKVAKAFNAASEVPDTTGNAGL
eukprot:scaffold79794_cov42-Cyclotella_meneghiniana.AAC.2